MSKAVLLSIRPEWCALIASGEKTAEVRKTKPSGVKLGELAEPFKCYIYCTSVKSLTLDKYGEVHSKTGGAVDDWSGKVFAEFLCDGIYQIRYTMDGLADVVDCKTTCLMPKDFIAYGKGKPLYGWSISEPKVYDTPKELKDFYFPPELYCEKGLCGRCPKDQVMGLDGDYAFDCEWEKPITRPPQSWCYVEEEIARSMLFGWKKICTSDIESLEFEFLPEKEKQRIRERNFEILKRCEERRCERDPEYEP